MAGNQYGLKFRFLGSIDDAYKLGNENVIFFPNQRWGAKSVGVAQLFFMSEDFYITDSNSKMEIAANINN